MQLAEKDIKWIDVGKIVKLAEKRLKIGKKQMNVVETLKRQRIVKKKCV
jgi:hypothetical protein